MRPSLFLLSALMAFNLNALPDAFMPSVYLTPKYTASENAPVSIQIAGADEPGEKLVITGQVVYGDTPIAGASVFVEQQAAAIMADHQGRIAQAFESVRNPDGSGEEVHLVEFADEACFMAYRSDSRLAELQELRSKTISKTVIRVLDQERHYG